MDAGIRRPGLEADKLLPSNVELRMSGTIFMFLHTPSWRCQGQLYPHISTPPRTLTHSLCANRILQPVLHDTYCVKISDTLLDVCIKGCNDFVVLYGCETWSVTLRDEHRLRVFENTALRGIFETKRDEVTGDWRKLLNE
jgi:hypothetical protein